MPPDLVRLVADEPKGPVCLYRLTVGVNSHVLPRLALYVGVLGIWIQVLNAYIPSTYQWSHRRRHEFLGVF